MNSNVPSRRFRTALAAALLTAATWCGTGPATAEDPGSPTQPATVQSSAEKPTTPPPLAKASPCPYCTAACMTSGKSTTLTTGTAIPETVKRKQSITDGHRNVRVEDRRSIRRTGAATLTEALRAVNR